MVFWLKREREREREMMLENNKKIYFNKMQYKIDNDVKCFEKWSCKIGNIDFYAKINKNVYRD